MADDEIREEEETECFISRRRDDRREATGGLPGHGSPAAGAAVAVELR